MYVNAIESILSQYGMTECPECKSWIYKTKAARNFHFRRCNG